MVKTLTAGVAEQIQTQYGTEPFLVVGITWAANQAEVYYSDRDYPDLGLTGNILSITPINDVTAFDSSGSAQSVTIVLDDTLGALKYILDTTDIHKRPLNVYQSFAATGDLTQIFGGLINTPASWSEGERTVTLTAVSSVEDRESGFSPEEWQFPFLSRDLMGKPWPLVFGSCLYVPAQKVKAQTAGDLNTLIGIVDPSLAFKMQQTAALWSAQLAIFNYWGAVAQQALSFFPTPDIPGVDAQQQGKNFVAEQLIQQYCAAIVAEDAQQHAFNQIYDSLQEAEKKQVDDLVNRNAIGVEIRGINSQVQEAAANLATIRKQKDQIEQMVWTAQYCVQIAQASYQRQAQAVTQMSEFYNQYVQLGIEQCRQEALQVTSLNVIEGNKFPQNVLTDVIIRDVRYSGTFNDNTFSIDSGPLNKYSNLAVGPWQGATDACGDADELKGISLFYLADPSYSLRDCWCQVMKNDGTLHLIHIIDQIGVMCRFELVPWQDPNGSGGGFIDPYSVQPLVGQNGYVVGPTGNVFSGLSPLPAVAMATGLTPAEYGQLTWGPFVGLYNTPAENLDAEIMALLAGADPINQHEYSVLATLEQLDLANVNPVISLTKGPEEIYTVIGPDITEVVAVCSVPLASWFSGVDYPLTEYPTELTWQAEVGTPVLDISNACEIYVANILPTTIKGVHAYRTITLPTQNKRVLAPVPQSYYRINQSDFLGDVDEGVPGESLTVSTVSFYQPLKSIQGENWEEEVYVTQTSSVGPNVSDIIKWLVLTYTQKAVDPTSFAAVAAQMRRAGEELYPCNFALLERKDVKSQIEEIARLARCAVYERDETIFIIYLAARPIPVATITENNVELSTLRYELTPTENLTTRYTAQWLENYLPILPGKEPNKIVLRYNVAKYFLHAKEEDYYIYNIQDLVLKSATFWMIREANTWKRVTLNTFLTNLAVDTFDAVQLDFATEWFASEPTLGIVESAVYDSDSKTIQLTLWLPVRQGEMNEYPFAFPATMASQEFPTQSDIQLGYAGGGGPGILPSGLDCATMGVGPANVS